MKFYNEHRLDILAAMEAHGLSKSQFSFIKRKGRIITHYDLSKSTFSYIVRSETTIDVESKEWIDVTYFQTQTDKNPVQIAPDWSAVLIQMNKWLSSL